MTPESEHVLREWMAERNAEMAAALQRVRGRYRADRLSQPTAYRKITEQADNRMRTRTAREQYVNAMVDLHPCPDDTVPDADNGAAWAGVMR